MTDYWSSQERCIVDGFSINFCIASGTILEGNMVKFSATADTDISVDNVVYVENAVALGDAIGIALKAGTGTGTTGTVTGEPIPVLFYGVHKMLIAGTHNYTPHQIYANSCVLNSTSSTKIVAVQKTVFGAGGGGALCYFHGASHVLGRAMQFGDDGDEILVLVGCGP